jgi:hypothetical protein
MPSTLTVLNNLDSGPGSLRAEIAAAKSGDTINFLPKLDGQTITLTSGELLVTGVTIQGPGAGLLTVSGNNQSRVFEVNGSAVLSGLTISNGLASTGTANGGGGGILIDGGCQLTVSGCTISNNQARIPGRVSNGYGGGICNLGYLTVNISTISNNQASTPGRGSAGYGGGIYNSFAGFLTISNSTLSGNSAGQGYGGGIATSAINKAELTNCTLANNAAWYGGGLYVAAGEAWTATATLTNCTVSLNSARTGGGIYVVQPPTGNGFGGQAGTIGLTNTIVAGNTASYPGNGSGPDLYDPYGFWITNDHNLIGGNALLGPLQNNGGPTQTMAQLPGSPAIGHADTAAAPATDQREVTRRDVPGESTDIGAFEV